MPGVAALKEEAEEARDAEQPALKAEEIKLWVPSELETMLRRWVCRRGVADVEARVRHAQCGDALVVLRSRLHAQTHLITWRNSNAVGQRAATWSVTLIGRVSDRITRVATKYRHAREALIALKGEEFAPEYKVLADADLNTNEREESDVKARRKLARLGSRKLLRNEPSDKPKAFSWLWMVGGRPGEDEAQLHECE
jgi:hypothetical protein